MSVIKDLLTRAAGVLPVSFWENLSGIHLLLPYYHLVTDDPAPHVRPLYRFRSTREFRADVECLLRRWRPLDLPDLLAWLRHGDPQPPRGFLITFDDGFREMHDLVMPILRHLGVPAVFFLNSATLDNRELCYPQKIALLLDALTRRRDTGNLPNTLLHRITQVLHAHGLPAEDALAGLRAVPWSHRALLDPIADIAEVSFADFLAQRRPYLTHAQVDSLLAAGFRIGGHSIDHPRYRDIPLDEQLRQTRTSQQYLVDHFAIRERVFAFPHSDLGVSRRFFEIVRGDGTVEATFGTAAPLLDRVPGSFQRFSMEKTELPAPSIVARQHLRLLGRKVGNRASIERS